MKIALCQINSTVGDLEGNASKIIEYYKKAAAEGAEITVFPELCITGYPPMDLVGRKDFVERQLDLLKGDIAGSVGDCAMILGAVTFNDGKGKPYFNSAVLVHNKKIAGIINKQLLPTYDLFDEKRHYQPGSASVPVEFKGKRIGISVCEDMWASDNESYQKLYPVDPLDELAGKKIDFFINISASPFSRGKDSRRQRLIERHVKKWDVPFVLVNTVGANDSVVFDGKSRISSAKGRTVVSAGVFTEDMVIGDVFSTSETGHVKANDTEDVFNAIVLGIGDYVRKSGLEGVVIGSSGGIDSALVAVLSASAVGPGNVLCVTMPTRFSSKGSVDDSRKLCKNLGVELMEFPVEKIFSSYTDEFNKYSEYKLAGLANENIQPRIRGNILMALSNSMKGRVAVATGNKSEISTGYCTIYGDTCGALAPIGDVYKTEVYELAAYVNREREIIPAEIVNKAPSAELRPGQKDSDSLPEYGILDRILRLYIDGQKPAGEIVKLLKVDKALVDRVVGLVFHSEFKRRQLPPVIKVSERSFVLDRRFPVVHRMKY